jgi:hypothetical protein
MLTTLPAAPSGAAPAAAPAEEPHEASVAGILADLVVDPDLHDRSGRPRCPDRGNRDDRRRAAGVHGVEALPEGEGVGDVQGHIRDVSGGNVRIRREHDPDGDSDGTSIVVARP